MNLKWRLWLHLLSEMCQWNNSIRHPDMFTEKTGWKYGHLTHMLSAVVLLCQHGKGGSAQPHLAWYFLSDLHSGPRGGAFHHQGGGWLPRKEAWLSGYPRLEAVGIKKKKIKYLSCSLKSWPWLQTKRRETVYTIALFLGLFWRNGTLFRVDSPFCNTPCERKNCIQFQKWCSNYKICSMCKESLWPKFSIRVIVCWLRARAQPTERLPWGPECPTSDLLAVWSWTGHFLSLHLGSILCKMV